MAEANQCKMCGTCCRYIAIEIDKPQDRDEYNNIIWYLLHEDVHVYVDHDDDWVIEFATRCKALGSDDLCRAHAQRPLICRKHDPDNCVNNGDCDNGEQRTFRTVADFKRYCEEQKLDFELDFPDGY